MDAPVKVTKACLKNTPMFLHRLRGQTEQKYSVLLLFVLDFPTKQDDLYVTAETKNRQLTAVTRRQSFNVTIKSEDYDKIKECFVCYGKQALSKPFYGRKMTVERRYYVEIPIETITNSENTYCERKKFALLFKIAPDSEATPLALQPPLRERTYYENYYPSCLEFCHLMARSVQTCQYEEDKMAGNLKGMWDSKSFVDFVIRVERKKIHVHKALLAVRSTYLREYIRRNCVKGRTGEMKINATYEVMNAVVRFLYTGSIQVKSLEDMLATLELAVRLNLRGLQRLCVRFLEKNIKEDNVHQIKETGRKCRLNTLLSVVDAFMASNKSGKAKKQSSMKSESKKF